MGTSLEPLEAHRRHVSKGRQIPNARRSAGRLLRSPEDGPEVAQDGPKTDLEGPKTVPDCSMTAPAGNILSFYNVSGGIRRSRSNELYVGLKRPLKCVGVVLYLGLLILWLRASFNSIRCTGRTFTGPRVRRRRTRIETSRPHTQMNVLIWPRIVRLEVGLELFHIVLVLLVVYVILSL